MKFFKNLKIKIESFSAVQMIDEHWGQNFVSHDIRGHGVLGIIEGCEEINIPFDQLNSSVGEKLLEMVARCQFSENSRNVLAHFLQNGLAVNDELIQFIDKGWFQNRMRDSLTHRADWEPQNKLEVNKKHVIDFLDLLTTFGAKWDIPSNEDRQYPTVLDHLYHTTSYNSDIQDHFKQFYVDRDPLKKKVLDSKEVMRHRLEKLFASDQNDMQIETGEKVTISAIPKITRKHS